MAARLWDWLAKATCPGYRVLFTGPRWTRSIAAWWLSKWGWCFMYTKPWRPGRFDEDAGL